MRKRITYKNIFGIGLAFSAFSFAVAGIANAQECAALPTCEEFGYLYTAEECAGQKYVKCPFDQTKYFCLEDSNVGGNCDNPKVGDILYSDKSCSSEVVSGKTPIAVVFNADRRLAIALETEEKAWSTSFFNVPDLKNCSYEGSAKADWTGKSNTNVVLNYCRTNSKSCPAFEYVSTYTTTGTSAGDWYLPAFGEVNNIYENRAVLNRTLSLIGGTQLPGGYHWSSSAESYYYAWGLLFTKGDIRYLYKNYEYYCVRPVLEF